MWLVIARCALLSMLVACGDPPAHLQLVPVELKNQCGKPAPEQVNGVRVIAYTASGEIKRTAGMEISDFPADTEQLGVEVIGSGGAVISTGKTGPIAFTELAGGTLPIAMVPPGGFCEVGEMMAARIAPLVARAGEGVLVAGGGSATAEYYDPRKGAFEPVALPSQIDSLAGAVLAAAPDGRVVLTGGPARVFSVFDPETKVFSGPYLFAPRAFHAALALDASHVLLTGGCNTTNQQCDDMATPLHSSLLYEYDAAGKPLDPPLGEPSLSAGTKRYGAALYDLGTESDGAHRLVLAGGFGDAGAADRIPLDSGTVTTAVGLHAQVTSLDGGALITAFDADGSAQTGAGKVLPPDGAPVAPIATLPALAGTTAPRPVLLEDGSVLAIENGPAVARYMPTADQWTETMPAGDAPGALAAPVLVRLADGSVLVLGAATSGTRAWIYRPSLVGPQSGSVTALPPGSADVALTAPDPAVVTRAGTGYTLHASDESLAARALVGGPRMTTGSIRAAVRVTGGLALIAQQLSAGRALAAVLVAGQPARLVRLDQGKATTLCSGEPIKPFDPVSDNVELAVRGQTATASIDDLAVVTCDLSTDPDIADRGAWGIAAVGANAEVDVVTITVAR